MPRYIIVGAGAVGGTIGGRLVRTGVDTVLVARGDHLQALRSAGLRLRTPDFDETRAVIAVESPTEVVLRTDDVLVASVKTQQLSPVLPVWADQPVHDGDGRPVGTAGDLVPLLTATNGVAAEGLAARYFAHVYGVCVWLPAARLDPGEVVARGTPISGVLHIGRVPGPLGDPARDPLLEQVVRDWTAAGFSVPTPPAVMEWKYRKLISNLGNVFEALVGDTRPVRDLIEQADAEARRVLDAAGIVYTGDAEEKAGRAVGFSVGTVPGIDRRLGGSTWQSLTRATGDIETDFLNGEVVRIAHACGTSAPVNATLARLGRRAVAQGWRPGDLSADQLRAAWPQD